MDFQLKTPIEKKGEIVMLSLKNDEIDHGKLHVALYELQEIL